MAKSALFTACLPSLPLMPTPTCASCSMGTSLAPSPMANVTGAGLLPLRIAFTSSAFCSGDTLQAMTTEQLTESSRKASRAKALPPKAFLESCSKQRPGDD